MMSLLLDRGRRTVAIAVTFLTVLALTVGLFPMDSARADAVVPTSQAPAATTVEAAGPVKAADLSQFRPGNIVSDAVFFDRNTMTEAQIQAFLEQKVPRCESGYTCLKDWYDTSRTTSADAMCGAYSGGARERASRIIYKVAQACGINPQVILVTLQKEQGLVTHVWPSEWRYTAAMGQGCPDTAACDSRYYGFFNQVYGAAWQLKRYANPPGTSQYFTWYAPGKTWNILYNPNRDCGSSSVRVENQATSNLYYYTPYQPNAAALRAGYGTGDGCSAYGNRNFFNYFTDWFGSTQKPVNACAQPADSALTVGEAEFVVNVASLNARSAPTTSCEPVVRSLSQGTAVTRTAVYGDWARIRIDGARYWVHGSYLSPAAPVPWTTSRVAGATRYETSVEVSKVTHPSGSKTVYLASGVDFPDALTAAPAAVKSGSALLLTDPNALPAIVRSELTRLAPSAVVIVGGVGAVSESVEAELAGLLPSASVERVGGVDRYETSQILATTKFGTSATAYIATGEGFADALAASSAAGAQGAAVILVEGAASSAATATLDVLRALRTSSVVIAGGTGVVSAGVASSLQGAGFGVTRHGGADRYQTSLLINSAVYPTAGAAILATGLDFPDSLAGAVLAGQTKVPLLSQPTSCMTGTAKNWLIARGVKSVRLIGGPGALTESVARSIRC
ncbi:cell wall-binding repeat-containing protein [Microbacterium sp. ET2]|uniref:cell wall-binding repeat-containing protein n=1 Tax=Microbacterium albipurpureum TaxID=3050384 RepID=UPI00259D12C3|nr:cell wall-binding repeat-containing protein [Microbacterium sp. ET2 (Ac-2212)]WJL95079.1 cell wall-binding repeat-containing protein [Microbacterium sp. ET2 (Ac-2212)]